MSPSCPPHLHLRPLRDDDLAAAWAMSQALRWPHRQEDWADYLHQAQAHGQAVAACKDETLIGTALVWHWGSQQASIGMVIVTPEWQGRGIGRHLLRQLLHDLDGRNVLLHATEAGMPLYASLDFVPSGRCRQYQGIWHPSPTATLPGMNTGPSADPATGLDTRALRTDDIDTLVAQDEARRGMARGWLLRQLLGSALDDATVHQPHGAPPPPSTVRAAVLEDHAGQRHGFGLLRRFGRGWVLGPVLADNDTQLLSLLRWLTRGMDGQFIRIDLSAPVPAFGAPARAMSAPAPDTPGAPLLHAWLQAQGLSLVDETTAMIRLGAPGATPPAAQPATAAYALLTQAQG